jgi:transcriptional regulator with XRE-family HTH domain
MNYFNIVGFLNYCPLEEIPQATGEQIFFYRKHRGISRRDLAEAIGTTDTEIKLWEKENFLVNCCGFGFTKKKKQALESALEIGNLPAPIQTVVTGKLPSNIQTMGQHLQHRRKALNLSKREIEQILKLRRKNYTRWEEDDMKRVSTRLLVRVVEFLGYCPMEDFSTEGQKLELYRRYAGLEQRELAASLKCLPKTLYHWECGRAKLSEKRKQQLKILLNLCFN